METEAIGYNPAFVAQVRAKRRGATRRRADVEVPPLERRGIPAWARDIIAATAAVRGVSPDRILNPRVGVANPARRAAIIAVATAAPHLSSQTIAPWFGVKAVTIRHAVMGTKRR